MSQLTYKDRIRLLGEKKLQHTLKKKEQLGYQDIDDNGTVPVPDDFEFHYKPNSPNGGIYGLSACAENFALLVDAHPVYVDPLEILCGRWRKKLPDYRKIGGDWDEVTFPFDHLKENQLLLISQRRFRAVARLAGLKFLKVMEK